MQPGMPDMMGDPGMQDPMGGGMQDPMMGGDSTGNPEMGGDPNAVGNDGQSQFDTNFDAGVEADEDEDPKRYIQQLTGKLSQSLNSYLTDNGGDEGLAKYVGKMIAKQAAKGLDDSGRKELIKSINMADAPDEDDEDTSDDMEPNNEIPQDGMEQDDMGQEAIPQDNPSPEGNIQETKISKKDLIKLTEDINNILFGERDEDLVDTQKQLNRKPSVFNGKKFKS